MLLSVLNEFASRCVPSIWDQAQRLKLVSHVREVISGKSSPCWSIEGLRIPLHLSRVVFLNEDSPLENSRAHVESIKTFERRRHQFSHHTAPCYDVGLGSNPRLLFLMHYSSEKAIQVLILGVIVLDELLETNTQVCAKARCVEIS